MMLMYASISFAETAG